jgi:plasmid stability protein
MLRRRAAANGRSLAQEVRVILFSAVKDEFGLGTRIATLFTGIGLREGEEIEELHGYKVNSPTFD